MKRLIIIGGNRLYEEYPLKSIIKLKKKYKIEVTLFTEQLHLNKPIGKRKKFKNFLINNKFNFQTVKNYNELKLKINKLLSKKKSDNYCLLLNSIFVIKNDIIDIFKNKIFNLHVGKLPEQRGGGVTTWQFMSNIKFSAVTVHIVEDSLDTGNIIIEKKIPCKNLKIPQDFYKKAQKIEYKALFDFFRKIYSGRIGKSIKQNSKRSVYMPRLDTNIHSFINWNWTAKEIVSFIRSFDYPFDGARSYIDGFLCILRDCHFHKEKINFHPFQYGLIYRVMNDYCFIAAQKGAIKTKINFTKKNKLKKLLGKRIFTPFLILENAIQTKSLHLPKGMILKKKKI